MNNYKKGFAQIVFLGIGLLVLVGAIGTTAVVVNKKYGPKEGTPAVSNSAASEKNGQGSTNANNATKDWKTYTNKDIGVTLKYPKNWYVNDQNQTGSSGGFSIANQPFPLPELLPTDFIKIQVKYYTKLKSESLITIASRPNELGGGIPKVESVVVAGLSAVKSNMTGDATYYLPKSETEYLLVVVFSNSENKQAVSAVVPKILSTFKFTDKSETADWKTYKSRGLSFDYPSSWKVKDNSYVRDGITYPLFWVSSPNNLNLPGYKGVDIYYFILISVDPSTSETQSIGGFSNDNGPKGSAWNTDLSGSPLESTTEEYKIGQVINKSVKFTK